MDLTKRDSSIDKKKEKKKKHDRSRSDEKKKKRSHDRDGSRDRKKKDKQKKHHKDRSRSKDREKDRQRRQKERERPKQNQKDVEKQIEQSKDRQRSKDKEKGRQKDRQREKDRDKQRERDRQRQRGKDKERERSRDKKHKDRRDRSKSKKDHKRRSNDRFKKDYNREDKYQRWRRQKDGYRFDSPPKSGDESQRSEDFDNMDRLNKMKAEKELVSSKADRKLYLGNLPPNITSAQLMQMLNSALKKMEINTDIEGDSIVSAWVSPDGVGHYAFVEFRTAQQATAGLALNGASLYGYQLKLGRPKQYIEYHKQLLSEFGSDGNIDTILRKVEAMGGFGQNLIVEERLVHPPSKVVMLKHIVTIQELAIDEEYKQIVEDVTEMAKRHGDVMRVLIPRPMEIDLQEVKKRVKGLGYIFIKYRTVEQAKYARKEFIKQMFSDRSVACSYFSQKRFDEGELDPIEKIVIDF